MLNVRKNAGRLAFVMAMSLGIGLTGSYVAPAEAKAKPKLIVSKKTIKVGEASIIKVKNVKKVTWSASNKKVKLNNKKKTSVKAVGVKKGKVTVTAAYKLSGKKKKLSCKLTIKNAPIEAENTATVNSPAQNTNAAAQTTAGVQVTQGAAATAAPTATPVPTPIPSPSVVSETGTWAYIPIEDDSLLKEYGDIFGNVGTCLTYNDGFRQQLTDEAKMEFVRKNYNSFTLENDMKPSFLLADSLKNFRNPVFNDLIDVNDAIAEGYYVPDNYSEGKVPKINYTNIDKILQIAADNGIRMRGHTLIWHSQTPTEFFREDYKTNGNFVNPEIMDQRVIYYVTNVIRHICESPNSSVVYTWDVVNEYFHQDISGDNANWAKIYNLADNSGRKYKDSTNRLRVDPSYVKLAFKAAYDELKDKGLQEKVPLFYNDYNTSQVDDKIVEMVNYINSKDDINTDGEKICAGVGMQCHLGLKWPTAKEQLGTVQKFLDAGFEVQITELDIENNTQASEAEYCDYWFNFMKGLVQRRINGSKITGVTFWGLCDAVSWRFGQSALLYGKDIDDPKMALYAAYAAAQTSWNHD